MRRKMEPASSSLTENQATHPGAEFKASGEASGLKECLEGHQPHAEAIQKNQDFEGAVQKAANKASSKQLGLSEHSRPKTQQVNQVRPIPVVAPAPEPEPTHPLACSSDATKHLSLPVTSEQHEKDPSTARTATKSTKKPKSKPFGSSEYLGKLQSQQKRVQSTPAAVSTKRQESTHPLPYSNDAAAKRSIGALQESVKKASSKPKQVSDLNTSAEPLKSVNKSSSKPTASTGYSERTKQLHQPNQVQLEPDANKKASSNPFGSSKYSGKPHLQQNEIQPDQPHSGWTTSNQPSLPHTSAKQESDSSEVAVMPKTKSRRTGDSQISGSNEQPEKPQSESSTEKACPPAAVGNSALNQNDLAQPRASSHHQSNQPTTTSKDTVPNQKSHYAATSTKEASPRNMDRTQSSHSCAAVQSEESGPQQPTAITKTTKETITDTLVNRTVTKENLPNPCEKTAVQTSDSRKLLQSDTDQQQPEIMTTTKEVVTDKQTRVTTLSEPLPGTSFATPTSEQKLHREHNSGTDSPTKPELSQPQTNIGSQLTSGNVKALPNLSSTQSSQAGSISRTGTLDQQQPVAKKTITEVVTDTECIVTTLKEKNQPLSDLTAANEDNTQPSPGPLPHTEALDQKHKEIKTNSELATDTHKKP